MKKNKAQDPNIFSAADETFSLSIGELMGKEKPPEPCETSSEMSKKNAADASDAGDAVASFAQVTLHRQLAGRGGRAVTLVAIKPLQTPAYLDSLAKILRKGLGCGAHVEEDRIVLQGDIPDRAKEWFLKKGARKVMRGN